ncbi:MAG: 4a-hydroxytetrahydrobiopterin dehydratase [Gemmatimonadales bacterium]
MSETRLTPEELATGLVGLPRWKADGGRIVRRFETDGWRGSMLVAGAVAFVCEAADHHADVLVTWPAVTISLSTHSAGGITGKDLEVAALIETQVTWQPGPGSSLRGPATPFVKS